MRPDAELVSASAPSRDPGMGEGTREEDGGQMEAPIQTPSTVPNASAVPHAAKSSTFRAVILAGSVLVVVAVVAAVVLATRSTDAPVDGSWDHVVVAALKLPYSKSDFDIARQLEFRTAIAKAADTLVERVNIVSIKETPARRTLQLGPARRAEGGSIRVDFEVEAATAVAASTLAVTLTEDKLNQALEGEGLEKGVMLARPKATTKDEANAPSPSPAASSPSPAASPPASAPPNARRASYREFETCEEISAQFGGSASERRVTGPLLQQLVTDTASPHFPDDYCDHCNCSLPKKDQSTDRMFASGDMMPAAAESATAAGGDDATSSGAAEDFSGTNNQVAGVDEADSVKNDGQYIYQLPQAYGVSQQLVIAKAFPAEDAQVVSTTDLSVYDFRPRALLLHENVLVVIGSSSVSILLEGGTVQWVGTTMLQLWDVSDKSNPSLLKTTQIEGWYLSGRMIDGRTYIVVQTYPAWVTAEGAAWTWSSSGDKYLRSSAPLFRELQPAEALDAAQRARVPFGAVETTCNKIGVLLGLSDNAEAWVTVLAVDADSDRSTFGSWKVSTHAGRGSTVYVSRERIFVAATTYTYDRVDPAGPLPAADVAKPARGVWSVIMRFDLNRGAPTFAGIAEVEGSIINQFAMDEHQGYLRVATTRGEMWASPPTSESAIAVLNPDLVRVGLLEGLAPGERIYSVRFMGARGYVVTYRQVDPFFVFDLSRPENPATLGYLKIPGFSDYLHPLASNYMLGVGKDTEVMNDAGRERVITKGVKLSLFNVDDPENPTEEAVLVLGDRGSSTEVSYEHKAFLYHPASGVISLPVDLHQAERCKEARTAGGACPGFTDWAPTTFQGAYVIYLDGDDTKSFRVHGRITHEHLAGVKNDASDTSRVMWGLWGGWGWRSSLRRVYRSTYMDGLLYTLSDRHMQAHALSSMEEKAVLNMTLPTCYAPAVWANTPSWMFRGPMVEEPAVP